MSWVNGSGANRPQECRNHAHENIFLLELRTRSLPPCVSRGHHTAQTSEIYAEISLPVVLVSFIPLIDFLPFLPLPFLGVASSSPEAPSSPDPSSPAVSLRTATSSVKPSISADTKAAQRSWTSSSSAKDNEVLGESSASESWGGQNRMCKFRRFWKA